MMNQREATWARTGTDVSGLTKIEDVLKTAKLDYVVEKTPLHLPNGVIVPGKYATVKQGTDEVFGIVGNNYTICQNTEAFDFVNYIDEDLKFIKAGQTRTGIIYIIAKLPETYVMDDKVNPYVIFQNGHNGQLSVKAAVAPLRIVCQNQFNIAFKDSDNAVTLMHASTLESRLQSARDVLKTTAGYMDRFRREAEELYSIKVNAKEQNIINSFYEFKEDMRPKQVEKIEEKRIELLNAYRDLDDNQNFRGTAWGLVNAYADVITHQEPGRKTENWEESKFMQVTFNPRIMQSFINHIKASA